MNHLFEPVFSWQRQTWQRLTAQYPNTAHGLLFAGKIGTGKKQFAEKFMAWVLCDNKEHVSSQTHACGTCQSCLWLAAKTHPQFLHITVSEKSKSNTIKVDDVRKILPFTQQSSHGKRVVFIELAERLNISAANALLKTLEEPHENVLFLLSCNQPQQLLPTVISRIQAQQVSIVDHTSATNFVQNLSAYQTYKKNTQSPVSIKQLLSMVDNAPLQVSHLLQSKWFSQRTLWLKTWQALRAGHRDNITASQFWQKEIDYQDAHILQMLMCRDLLSFINQMPCIQEDLDFNQLKPLPAVDSILTTIDILDENCLALAQNVHQSYLYDKLLANLANT